MPKKHVRKTFGAEVALEDITVVLDSVAGVRARAHVGNKANRVPVEQLNEDL